MYTRIPAGLLGIAVLWTATAGGGEVRITSELESVDVVHEGKPLTIRRNPDNTNRVNPVYSFTSRDCPPFCVLPMTAAPGVETVGELEVLGYLAQRARGEDSVLVVDARTAQWPGRGMIPGAVNVPWVDIDPEKADSDTVRSVFEGVFGARRVDGEWDFGGARTLVVYCNGMWCSQSTGMVTTLLGYGYPPEKVKWYRGGMQNWENLGLTTVKSTN